METEINEEIANKIYSKVPKVNKLLSCCELDSKLSKGSTEEKLEKIFSTNLSIFEKGRSRNKFNVSKGSDVLNRHAKISTDIPKRKLRSGSVSSLASDESNRDYQAEIVIHLKEMRKIFKSIKNTSIKVTDGGSAFEQVTTFNSNFLQLVFGLQKIAREMNTIALNDSTPSNSLEHAFVDDNFIDGLSRLEKCLDDMLKLNANKNPVTNMERKENIKLKYTSMINNILATIEKNPH